MSVHLTERKVRSGRRRRTEKRTYSLQVNLSYSSELIHRRSNNGLRVKSKEEVSASGMDNTARWSTCRRGWALATSTASCSSWDESLWDPVSTHLLCSDSRPSEPPTAPELESCRSPGNEVHISLLHKAILHCKRAERKLLLGRCHMRYNSDTYLSPRG